MRAENDNATPTPLPYWSEADEALAAQIAADIDRLGNGDVTFTENVTRALRREMLKLEIRQIAAGHAVAVGLPSSLTFRIEIERSDRRRPKLTVIGLGRGLKDIPVEALDHWKELVVSELRRQFGPGFLIYLGLMRPIGHGREDLVRGWTPAWK